MPYFDDEEHSSYHDDPILESIPKSKKKSLSKLLSLALLLASGSFFLQTTLAANINITSGTAIEFGQGVAITAACSQANILTITPNSQFTNASGGGSHYLKSITLSGIPVGCNGVDFLISAFDSTTSIPKSIFNTDKTVATVWDNAGTFQIGSGGTGATVTSGSGTFTITFSVPVALATTVYKLTLQSTSHTAFNCILDGICSVGDNGPGGGTVYFVSAAAFTSTGSTCASNCHYLEVAKSTWINGVTPANDGQGFYLSFTATPVPAQDFGTSFGAQVGTYQGSAEKNNWFIGQGLRNTQLIAAMTGNTTSNSVAVKAQAFAPVGYSSTVGQWFIPSFNELNELCKYANGQATGVTSVQCINNSPFNTYQTSTPEGFVGTTNYFSSSLSAGGSASVIYFGNGQTNFGVGLSGDSRGARPIRAF